MVYRCGSAPTIHALCWISCNYCVSISKFKDEVETFHFICQNQYLLRLSPFLYICTCCQHLSQVSSWTKTSRRFPYHHGNSWRIHRIKHNYEPLHRYINSAWGSSIKHLIDYIDIGKFVTSSICDWRCQSNARRNPTYVWHRGCDFIENLDSHWRT